MHVNNSPYSVFFYMAEQEDIYTIRARKKTPVEHSDILFLSLQLA